MIIPPMCEIKTFETIKENMVTIYQGIVPEYVPNESDTIMPVLEAFAYRELLLRTHFNAQIAGSFWQSATAENLDFIAAFFWITRLPGSKPTATVKFTINTVLGYDYVLESGLEMINNDGSTSILLGTVTIPTGSLEVSGTAELQIYSASSDALISATMVPKAYLSSVEQTTAFSNGSNPESDSELRERIALAFEDQTTAGSINSYKAWAIRADERIDDVSVSSAVPGYVDVLLHSIVGVDAAMITRVEDTLSADRVRPLTDSVFVAAATVVNFNVNAVLILDPLADAPSTLSAAESRLRERLNSIRIGHSVTLSMIISALSVDGVIDVQLIAPTANVTVSASEVAISSLVEVSIG
ncbi:baseplate J/gp47 family protein [Sulfuricurvum sp.]|uniref:baseplate J/gp47 family protein n=1 Tax=Sulfuricurvum sp. TaxID=2025608 RepID=UPI00261E1D86|nr:baseplate J/gp47 family protein [Sulfuricurvum sp.]MDD2267017.1 baseplate J/gp47 family protein [Sulfuricurvum sp.]MDD2782633.1 baseplate J/gp47 family protein [Sulfuricurvum sp.]